MKIFTRQVLISLTFYLNRRSVHCPDEFLLTVLIQIGQVLISLTFYFRRRSVHCPDELLLTVLIQVGLKVEKIINYKKN